MKSVITLLFSMLVLASSAVCETPMPTVNLEDFSLISRELKPIPQEAGYPYLNMDGIIVCKWQHPDDPTLMVLCQFYVSIRQGKILPYAMGSADELIVTQTTDGIRHIWRFNFDANYALDWANYMEIGEGNNLVSQGMDEDVYREAVDLLLQQVVRGMNKTPFVIDEEAV